jgi:hypothetical protein
MRGIYKNIYTNQILRNVWGEKGGAEEDERCVGLMGWKEESYYTLQRCDAQPNPIGSRHFNHTLCIPKQRKKKFYQHKFR